MAHTESFSCDPDRDRDIIEYLKQQDSKSQIIKVALRFYMKYGQSLTPEQLTERLEALPDVLELIKQLHDKIDNGGQFTSPEAGQQPQVSRRKAIDIMSQMDNL